MNQKSESEIAYFVLGDIMEYENNYKLRTVTGDRFNVMTPS